MTIPSDWTDLGKEMDPEVEEMVKANGPMHFFSSAPTIQALREEMDVLLKDVEWPAAKAAEVKCDKIRIPVRNGASIEALIYAPKSPPEGGNPLAVLYHAGGWCIGEPKWEEQNAVNLVQRYGCVAVSVDYRLAPEHPFPTSVYDGWDSLKWLAENASQLNANPSKGFIVGGSSAGASLAIILGHLARDEGFSPPLTGLYHNVPAVVAPPALPDKYKAELQSWEQCKEAPILNTKDLAFFINAYRPNLFSPLVSVLNWPSGHANLPRTYIQVCGLDPLRDEGLIYERELRECGVETKIDAYPGCPHLFNTFMPQSNIGKKFWADSVKGFGWLLGKE